MTGPKAARKRPAGRESAQKQTKRKKASPIQDPADTSEQQHIDAAPLIPLTDKMLADEPDEAKQYQTAKEAAVPIERLKDIGDGSVADFMQMVQKYGGVKKQMGGDKDLWTKLKSTAASSWDNKGVIETQKAKLVETFSAEKAARLFEDCGGSTYHRDLNALARAAKGRWDIFTAAINRAIYDRVLNGGRGTPTFLRVITSDVKRARKPLVGKKTTADLTAAMPPLSADELARIEGRLDEFGLVVPLQESVLKEPTGAKLLRYLYTDNPEEQSADPKKSHKQQRSYDINSPPVLSRKDVRDPKIAATSASSHQPGQREFRQKTSELNRLNDASPKERYNLVSQPKLNNTADFCVPLLGRYDFDPRTISKTRIAQLLARSVASPCIEKFKSSFDDYHKRGYLELRAEDQVFNHWDAETEGLGDDTPRSLSEQAFLEAHIYDLHTPIEPGRRTGTLDVMLHGVTQQVARMDLGMFLLHLALRKDEEYKVLAYPTSTRYFTAECHGIDYTELDAQPERFLSETGGYAHESQQLVLVLKRAAYTHLLVPKAGRLPDAYPTKSSVFPSAGECAAHGAASFIGVDFTNSDGEEGWTRIGALHLSCIAIHPLLPIRRQICSQECRTECECDLELPVVYLSTTKKNRELEVANTGTTTELKRSLQKLAPPRAKPNGTAAAMTYANPWEPSTLVRPVCGIGAALVGQASWDDPAVVQELRILFGEDPALAIDFYRETSQALAKEGSKAFAVFRQAETEFYGDFSAFKSIDSGRDKQKHSARIRELHSAKGTGDIFQPETSK
ncbi:hypothetical protein ATEIFO6365_0001101000 [Aspergillus terreus]|uniref:Uncharacterized protein n=1 Tax=Aspergillus terreus TaxID=33178 RepID=A0A5M3YS61_ASPTE|nr:hypothetical protein ATETN484_0001093100 [Aspergillus terreus]GFF12786.1 hypothetical protein ATEIFO6365_0001101000 [Aspergillus terreus]